MTKEYFSHDYDARNDLKIIALRKDFGAAGYGIYWFLIEKMYQEGGKIEKFPALFSSLSDEFKVKESALTKQIEAMLNEYELLLQDASHIWSNAVLCRLQMREERKTHLSEAGRVGGLKSAESRRSKPGSSQTKPGSTNRSKDKEKVKEKDIYSGLSDLMKDAWSRWKNYKRDQHKFTYKSLDSESAGLTHLMKLSEDKEGIAVAIVDKCIAKGWKGFYPLSEEDKPKTHKKTSLTEDQNSW